MSFENLKVKIVNCPPKKENTTVKKKKKAKKTTVFDDNDITEENNINIDELNKENEEENNIIESNTVIKKNKKKKKKKKLDVSTSIQDMNINPFNIDENEDEEEQKENKKKFNKKKSKSQIIYNKISDNEENDNDDISEKKIKEKKKKSVKISDEKEEYDGENTEVKTKKKKKKKKDTNNDNIEDNLETQNEIIENETISKQKKKKKKKKKENLDEDQDDNFGDDDIYKIKEGKNLKNNDDSNNNINDEEKEEKDKNEIKESKYNDNIKTKKQNLKSSVFDETKKKLGKIFFTKKKKNKNNDYIETEISGTESTIQKDKNVVEFLEKAKGITYKGYNYSIKKEDYFERKGIIITTILNSEDAAIKKCEEISNQIRDGEKWSDPDFGEQDNNISKNRESLYGDGNIPSGSPKAENIKWYPLSEISDYAQFFSDGVESNDVIQGGLGDCWFISALSVIATKDYLLRGEFSDDILADKKIDEEENVMLSTGIYPPIFHSFRKKDIFCFRFFKNFKWRYVLVDSRLPCFRIYNNNQTPTLLYGQCRARNEFWVPLIEKAYAKLHGSYRSLVSGFIDDGLVDLTGLTSNKMLIEPNKLKTKQKADELWNILLNNSKLYFNEGKQKTSEGKIVSAKFFTRNKTMMGCSVDSKGNTVEMEVILHNRHTGVLAGHAYSILDVFEIPKPKGKKRKTSRLLRIRNPWGRKEWNGKWSDDSVETRHNKERIEQKLNEKYKETNEKINLSQEDGTFLMCFSDFRQIFNKLFICKNFPPNYLGIRLFGQWTEEESGGLPVNAKQERTFYSNPQFYIKKNIDGLLSISLLQKDGRLEESTFPFPGTINKVCLLLFRVNSKNKITNLNNLIDKTLIVSRRDLILELNLPKGSYIIIPSTFESGKKGDFCLELHFEDELIQDYIQGENIVDCLKNTYIEKLGEKNVKWEILSEFISSKAKSTNTNKEQFIIQKFKEIIKDDDDYEYSTSKRKLGFSNRGNEEYDDEDLDYI